MHLHSTRCPILVLTLLAVGCTRSAPEPVDADAPAGTVTVVLKMPDGEQRVEVPDVRSGETVLSVMERIESPEVHYQGSGSSAFITRIGQISTSASEGWTFYVNGQWADRGPGVYQLQPGDTIQWRYGSFSEAAPAP